MGDQRKTIYIGGLPVDVNRRHVEKKFIKFGDITDINKLVGTNYALVEFKTKSGAKLAIEKGKTLFDDITVEYSRKRVANVRSIRNYATGKLRSPRKNRRSNAVRNSGRRRARRLSLRKRSRSPLTLITRDDKLHPDAALRSSSRKYSKSPRRSRTVSASQSHTSRLSPRKERHRSRSQEKSTHSSKKSESRAKSESDRNSYSRSPSPQIQSKSPLTSERGSSDVDNPERRSESRERTKRRRKKVRSRSRSPKKVSARRAQLISNAAKRAGGRKKNRVANKIRNRALQRVGRKSTLSAAKRKRRKPTKDAASRPQPLMDIELNTSSIRSLLDLPTIHKPPSPIQSLLRDRSLSPLRIGTYDRPASPVCGGYRGGLYYRGEEGYQDFRNGNRRQGYQSEKFFESTDTWEDGHDSSSFSRGERYRDRSERSLPPYRRSPDSSSYRRYSETEFPRESRSRGEGTRSSRYADESLYTSDDYRFDKRDSTRARDSNYERSSSYSTSNRADSYKRRQSDRDKYNDRIFPDEMTDSYSRKSSRDSYAYQSDRRDSHGDYRGEVSYSRGSGEKLASSYAVQRQSSSYRKGSFSPPPSRKSKSESTSYDIRDTQGYSYNSKKKKVPTATLR